MPKYTVRFTIKEERSIDVEAASIDEACDYVEDESFIVLRYKSMLDGDLVEVDDVEEIE